MLVNKKVKIVATMGPASESVEMVEKLVRAGVNVFRINMSHGSHEEHARRFKVVREVENIVGEPLAVLADLQGPKLRVGTFENDFVMLEEGKMFRLDLDPSLGNKDRVCLPHKEIFESIKVGTELLIDDGKLKVRVEDYGTDYANTRVVVGGKISNKKGVNVPNAILKISALTEKDMNDLNFALELGVEWIALSFVQRPEDVIEAREIVKNRASILSKIEKPSAVEMIKSIIAHSDAIMVARGDLGVEMPAEVVPLIQKEIISESRKQGKPVIVATQMLESMISSPVPTRAEVSDIANAVFDGTDAIMLSAESSVGSYPVEAVTVMTRTIQNIEASKYYYERLPKIIEKFPLPVVQAITTGTNEIANSVGAKLIAAYTSTGTTAYRISRERPKVPLLTLTKDITSARRMMIGWGLFPKIVEEIDTFMRIVETTKEAALKENLAARGDVVVILAGVPIGTPGKTNTIRITVIE